MIVQIGVGKLKMVFRAQPKNSVTTLILHIFVQKRYITIEEHFNGYPIYSLVVPNASMTALFARTVLFCLTLHNLFNHKSHP